MLPGKLARRSGELPVVGAGPPLVAVVAPERGAVKALPRLPHSEKCRVNRRTSDPMHTEFSIDPNVKDLAVGLVRATGIHLAASPPDLVKACRIAVESTGPDGVEGGDERRQAVRSLLRHGGYKPSGRGKPAQEYLLRTAQTPDQWPVILNAVDLLNVVSLRSGLPISLVALDRLQPPLLVRYGQSGESFVFNQAGQVLDVTGLICICHTVQEVTQPVGTPVKDSQLAKVTVNDSQVLACIFAPCSAVPAERLQIWTEQLADAYRQWCAPERVETQLLPSTW